MTIILFKGEDNHFKALVEVINKYNVPYCIREGALQTYLQVDKSYTYEQVQILHAEKKLNDILGYKMLSVKEAKDIVHSKSKINIINVTSNNLTIDDVVAEDIYSVFNHPLYPTSMRDGYGWNTKWNKDSKLKVINSIYAEGDEKNKLNNIQENETVYICLYVSVCIYAYICVSVNAPVYEYMCMRMSLRLRLKMHVNM
jgi:hypothetical protein